MATTYLLSATFKDCIIIVRLDFLRPGDSTRQSVKIQPESVTVIDLDQRNSINLNVRQGDCERLDEYSTATSGNIWNKRSTFQPVVRKLCNYRGSTTIDIGKCVLL